MDIKYSVIIPAYNAEKTLKRCLDSLVRIIRDDVELLVINDGSSDRTGKICLEYVEKYRNVRYFFKDNGGVSSARNLGLDKAEGKYVLFVDSDDFVEKDYFYILDETLIADPDFSIFGKTVYNGITFVLQPIENCSAFSCIEATQILSKGLERQLLNSPVSKVFKRNLIEENKLRFDERLLIGEDKVFVVQYIMHASTVIMVNKPIYVVSIENNESLSRKKREDLCSYILLEHELLFKAIIDSGLNELNKQNYMRALAYSYYRSAYTVIAELHKLGYSKRQRLNETKAICKRYRTCYKCETKNLKCILIAMPIRLKLYHVIDLILHYKIQRK